MIHLEPKVFVQSASKVSETLDLIGWTSFASKNRRVFPVAVDKTCNILASYVMLYNSFI